MGHTLQPPNDEASSSSTFVCNVCFEAGYGASYHCPDCLLHIHPACAAAPPPTAINHPSHPQHPLLLVRQQDLCRVHGWQCIACSCCAQIISHLVYHCEPCDFDLHPFCAVLPRCPLLPTHSPHRLELLTKPPYPDAAFICSACGRMGKSWVYHCVTCEYDLHPQCANLWHQAIILQKNQSSRGGSRDHIRPAESVPAASAGSVASSAGSGPSSATAAIGTGVLQGIGKAIAGEVVTHVINGTLGTSLSPSLFSNLPGLDLSSTFNSGFDFTDVANGDWNFS